MYDIIYKNSTFAIMNSEHGHEHDVCLNKLHGQYINDCHITYCAIIKMTPFILFVFISFIIFLACYFGIISEDNQWMLIEKLASVFREAF